jgi:WS/DGAT/MGAT family acyltransferase
LRAARASIGTARRLASSWRPRAREAEAEESGVEIRHSWLNAGVSPYRSVAWCSLPLDELRSVGRTHGASINDTLLAVVGSALRRWAEDRFLLPDFPLVASVPIAIRDEGDERANAVSAVAVSLGTELRDPVARLESIRDATSVKKRDRGRSVGNEVAAWADVPPPLVFSLMSRAYVDLDLSSRVTPLCNLVVSSVPGPPDALYFCGARLEAIYPMGPVFSGMGLNVTAISCGDRMDVGLVACRKLVPDLRELAEGLADALAELNDASRSSPGR